MARRGTSAWNGVYLNLTDVEQTLTPGLKRDTYELLGYTYQSILTFKIFSASCDYSQTVKV